MSLYGHIFFAAEGPAVRYQLDEHLVFWVVEICGDLPLVIEDALTLGEQMESAVVPRYGEGALGFEEEMLDALSLPVALDHVRAHADDLQARLELVDRCEERGDFGLALELLDGAGDTAGVHHRRGRLYQARGIPALAPSLSIDTSELDLPAVRRR